MKKYNFRPYNKDYPRLYKREKEKLLKILPKDAKIEHVGSTAVKGLGGKGIIDIIISVNNKILNKTIRILQKSGYIFKSKSGSKNRKFFEKDYKYKNNIRRVHLQLTSHDSKIWKSHLAIRDYLNENKEVCMQYSKLKKKAVKFSKGEGIKYRKYKENFLKKLENSLV